VKERNDKKSLCRRMSHSTTRTIIITIIIINNNNNKYTFLTSQQYSLSSTECVSNAQALPVYCSAKNFLATWCVLNISACCIRMYSAGRRLRSFVLPCNLLGIIPVVYISIIRHVLGLDRTVAASSNNIFRGVQSRILPDGLNFSIIFGIRLLLILVICRRHFDFYLLCYLVLGSTFNSSKIFYYFFFGGGRGVKNGVPGCSENFNLDWCQSFLSLLLRVQISLPYKGMGSTSPLYTFILANFWTNFGIKLLFRIQSVWENFASFCWIFFHFPGKFYNRDI
jgi:hypothetical protein